MADREGPARNYDLVVFDWDGTLADSTALIADAIQAACQELGEPPPGEAAARYVIGLGFESAVRHVAPALDPAAYSAFSAVYRNHYMAGEARVLLFEGVRELLGELADQGYRLAIATGKSRAGLDRALAQSGLHGIFHATRCADEGPPKPHPDMLNNLMRFLATEPQRTLMIGDTSHDLELARNAGTRGVGVAYGAHSADALACHDALAIFESIAALRSWLTLNG
ncbi:MAG: HAD-IIIA family hydrolase [Casimicrobiaceae bacterium]